MAPQLRGMRDPIARLSFAFKKYLDKATADPVWTRLGGSGIANAGSIRSLRSGADLKADIVRWPSPTGA